MTSVCPGELVQLRERAETHLRTRTATSPDVPAADLQRLQHELEIHQIMLTLQVEELKRAQAEIEAGLVHYTDLFDLAPVGCLNLTDDGTIRLVNLTGAHLIGADRSRLLGRRLGLFVAEADRPALADLLTRVFATAPRQSCELRLSTADGPSKVVRIDAQRAADGQECRAVFWDRTEQLREEHAHRQLAMAIEQAAETIVITDLDGAILYANPAFERTTGYSVAEAMGHPPPHPQERGAGLRFLPGALGGLSPRGNVVRPLHQPAQGRHEV